jgi:hypothetical protein
MVGDDDVCYVLGFVTKPADRVKDHRGGADHPRIDYYQLLPRLDKRNGGSDVIAAIAGTEQMK